jgi:hypothetical protein
MLVARGDAHCVERGLGRGFAFGRRNNARDDGVDELFLIILRIS